MPSADAAIALRGVQKDYRDLRPLRVERLELHRGESVALMGFDRVAAEVLVNLITGATLPDWGNVDVFETPTGAATNPDAWLAAMDQFRILSERVVLLESYTVEQDLALLLSLEVDEIPVTVRATVRQLADEVGVAPHSCRTPSRSWMRICNCAFVSARRLPSVLVCCSPNTPTSRCRPTGYPDSRLTSQALRQDVTWQWSS